MSRRIHLEMSDMDLDIDKGLANISRTFFLFSHFLVKLCFHFTLEKSFKKIRGNCFL